MYNKKFTKDAFDGNMTVRVGHKLITNSNGSAIGTISRNNVRDLNGKPIATLDKAIYLPSGNQRQRTRIYSSEYGAMRYTDGNLYLDDEPVGYVAQRGRSLSSIFMLLAAILILLATMILIWLIELPFDDKPSIMVADMQGEWEKQHTIAVFDEKILPGSSGEYVFNLKNPHEVSLLYDFEISEYYNGVKVDNFPIEYRIKMNNILLETDQWLSAEDLKYYEITMLPMSTHSFTLEWRWSFEGGNDALDTYFGQSNGDYSIVFHMTAQTLTE